jgi:Spy/CpxP family protein refolding chaperone
MSLNHTQQAQQEDHAMTTRWALAIGLVLLLAGTLPASAQMMGGQGGMMGPGMMDMMDRGMQPGAAGMGDCPGMAAAEPGAFVYERPWISFALAHAKELALTPDQVKGLTTLRDEFQKDGARWVQDIREGEAALAKLYAQKPLDLTAIEAKLKELGAKQAELRLARVKAIDKGVALLTDEQRQKLFDTSRGMGRMMGAFRSTSPETQQ